MPGSTSLIGLKKAASAAVNGLTPPSLSVSDRLGINPFLSPASFTQKYYYW
jgi:hypothetical protein